jgi:hypothetical protein
VSSRVRKVTAKKRSHRLQVIRPSTSPREDNLYGTIAITPFEAAAGTKKLVNIPWGFQKRLVNVLVPAGMSEGKVLRLKGMGKITPDGGRGDLLLKVRVMGPDGRRV